MVPVSVDCPGCGAQTRSGGIVVGPSSLTNTSTIDLDGDLLKAPWVSLDSFAFVESLAGRTENVQRFIANRYHSIFAVQDGRLKSVCEHCGDGLPAAALRAPAMNGFVRLGRKKLVNNEGLTLFASKVVLTEFHGGTLIGEAGLRDGGYSLLLLCDAEDGRNQTGVIEIWHSVARNEYAIVIKGHEGEVQLVNYEDLEQVVDDIARVGLALTQLHLAQDRSPYCELARDLFLDALKGAGYEQDE
ncbi:hypothetical protein [Sinorhizobium meliloti]|uniref:hypothetical protein n=1 Tax=Rhizobium meliloti TaxID=382 RepID=UPI001F35C8AF|nr:hypothetical protein [Sinorhizobium meliloti]